MRDVDAAELLERVLDDAVAEEVVPGVREEPERRRHMRSNCRALRTRRPLARAALHLLAHLGRHLLQRHIADALWFGHGSLLPRGSGTRLAYPVRRIHLFGVPSSDYPLFVGRTSIRRTSPASSRYRCRTWESASSSWLRASRTT